MNDDKQKHSDICASCRSEVRPYHSWVCLKCDNFGYGIGCPNHGHEADPEQELHDRAIEAGRLASIAII